MIVIVDYGVGNLRSVQNMLRKIGARCTISGDPEQIRGADRIVLPGVGHFAHGMSKLVQSGLLEPLNWFARDSGRPVLGICLGAQILGDASEEAPGTPGLGWIRMHCERFPERTGLPVPHMGWNTIELTRPCPLFPALEEETRFYFVHSYRMICDDPASMVASTVYGVPFACVVAHENIYGTQFHPEKSHRYGLAMLTAFSRL
jgi:glutamine amidotransferase